MTRRFRIAILTSGCLLALPSLTGPVSAAGTCADEIRYLTEFMETTNSKRSELDQEAQAYTDNPLIVTKADGSTVDLCGGAPAARPFENWFGESIKTKDVEVRIVNARTLAEQQADDTCLGDVEKIQNWFDEIRKSGAAGQSG